ncbi:hypothetical protein L7F22_065376 [Adiantum nelumboides]|nr:hypothetical protein [Adiantum nelumboides]
MHWPGEASRARRAHAHGVVCAPQCACRARHLLQRTWDGQHDKSKSDFLLADQETRSRTGRLTSLLGLSRTPTACRSAQEALNRNILKRVKPQLRELYNILEVEFHPLSICAKIEPIISQIAQDEEMAKYVQPLHSVILTRLFQQLSQVYDSVKLSKVMQLVSAFKAPPQLLEHKAAVARKAILARRKELLEQRSALREKEEAEAKAERQRLQVQAEQIRVAEEQRKREQDRIKKEMEAVRIEEARKMAQSLKEKGGLKLTEEEYANMDTEKLVQLQVEQLEKEKKELAERLRIVHRAWIIWSEHTVAKRSLW